MVDMKLEAVVIAVTDVDRAKQFYAGLGWRLDADLGGDGFRIVQFTPPGSECSIQFGVGLTSAAPGSGESLLVVSDVDAVRAAPRRSTGADPSEVFHDSSGGYNRFDPDLRRARSRPGATYLRVVRRVP